MEGSVSNSIQIMKYQRYIHVLYYLVEVSELFEDDVKRFTERSINVRFIWRTL